MQGGMYQALVDTGSTQMLTFHPHAAYAAGGGGARVFEAGGAHSQL